MVTEQIIYDKLANDVPEFDQALIVDSSAGCGQSFDIVVVSNWFEGKNRLQRSRAINKILKAEIAEMHAVRVKCYTVDEYAKLSA
ncbi:HGR094Wp [Eremothecium sinecaudum]|uniref:HGR094Wp n=1 Tax=Eremothecium sinecaudum TaxID=45286 RepID=A0A0X8HVZ7_9SACH|nr:HGR094Wp [Eremothecium sinecaudum]AMD22433.1 HGR094Wp [Eremothecium sinecaudum]